MNLYVGTYTDTGGPGIWFGELEGEKFTRRFALKDADNPNYLLLSKHRKTLFAVCGNTKNGFFVLSYSLSEDDAKLVSKQPLSGADPCHLALYEDEKFLFTANYADGSISVFPVEGDSILPECQCIRLSGKSIHPSRQEAPHTHHVSFAPEDKTLLRAVDLGLDKLISYRFNPETGRLSYDNAVSIPPGSGPRHLAYSQGGQRIYVVNELSNTASFIKKLNDTFHVCQSVSTLPEGFDGESTCAAIRLSEDERTLYASNRGHDSIAVFALEEDGSPIFTRHLPCGGKNPRDFKVLPGGRLLVANQTQGGLVLMNKDGSVLSSADIPGSVSIAIVESLETRPNNFPLSTFH